MLVVRVYYQSSQSESQTLLDDLHDLESRYPIKLVLMDVDANQELYKENRQNLPVIQVGPYRLKNPITKQEIQVAIGASLDRQKQFEQIGDHEYKARVERGKKISLGDRFSLWLSKHYMLFFNLIVAIYVGLPFLAPVFMKIGADGPANVIYTIYKPLCHQLAFRSFFLFGEQFYYPRELANIPGMLTYEQITNDTAISVDFAKNFQGNEVLGYKVALCERDVALYGSFLLFGILFAVTGRKWKSIPWYVWIIVGLVPIGLDGGSQLAGLGMEFLSAIFPVRESTPLLRVITGALFGTMTAWYLYPFVAEAMKDTHASLTQKFMIVKQLDEK